ncbi:serine hydrolase [Flavilitoribacter nigricans]|uniref:beta-lactamase n=1 Tax=Flavilitoribacter nigricans (strain ATCC 23147 / DSM 23189 / NBRC 102662 / NCIMB 1420 / SS-2) TaxID=1122177 RepID=A0A2D0N8R0_FLAN2|nr:serine hydrolase [Flavilitoribacter nigricans]PHN04770.1 serine hydrolase [Flavilitoribacter nigricans DSM 23189 = NBRC 102662]
MRAPSLLFVFLSFMATLFFSCASKMQLSDLEQQVKEEFDQGDGTFAMAFMDLTTGDQLLINARESFHAASTMKTPVLIELYKQSEAGKFSLEDSILVKNEFYSIVDSSLYSLNVGDDSESGLYDVVGSKRTVADLAYDMIIVSSNLATNLVIDLVDARKVTQTMRDLGAPDIQVLRGVEDIKAYELGMSNSTTAYDLMAIYEKLGRGEVVSPEASEAMIDILLDQKFNDIIPAHLPEAVKVAHKTGSITGVHHDSGIVMLPDGRKYVLVLLSKELGDFAAGTELLAGVSKMVYDYVK